MLPEDGFAYQNWGSAFLALFLFLFAFGLGAVLFPDKFPPDGKQLSKKLLAVSLIPLVAGLILMVISATFR